jgi:hypothetical protein
VQRPVGRRLERPVHGREITVENKESPVVRRFGYWSAILASAFSLVYVVGQLAEWLDLLGSGGGPENRSTALGLVVLLVPSLLLAPAFLVLVVSVHHAVAAERRIWTHTAVVFATIYAALVSLNYFVQLTLVVPHMIEGEVESIRVFLFTPFDSFIYSVDLLGYSFMSLATLFAAFALERGGRERTARTFLIANGLLLPFIALQNFYHPLIYVAALWAITFPGATISLAMLFGRSRGDSFPRLRRTLRAD